MVGRLAGQAQLFGLARLQPAVAQQRQHAQQALEGRADLMAHVGQEGALGRARILGLAPRFAQPGRQVLQRGAALLQLAHLAHRQQREGGAQRDQERVQRQAEPALLPQRLVAGVGALRPAVQGGQREFVHRCGQCLQRAGQGRQRRAVRRAAAAAAQVAVGGAHEGVHLGQGVGVVHVVGHQAQQLGRAYQADPADPDVIAQLQGLGVELVRGQRALPLIAQPQVLDLDLVDAERRIAVARAQRLLGQRQLAALHPHRRRQHERQHTADQAQPAGTPPERYRTSIDFSCHTERL